MLSVKEKIAYGLGDTASNIIFQTVMMFLLIYYTDVVGLSPAIVGTLFLVVRIFDAVTDPLMGALADRTHTKWGQFRPYLLWLALPFGIISVLAFTKFDLSDSGKIIYAFVSYTLLMIVYTAINIPYSALGGVLTNRPEERVSVQSYRFVFGMLGGLIVASGTMPLVDWLGDGDKAIGFQNAMLAMSVLGVVLFILCFLGTKERVPPPVTQQSSFKNDLKMLWQNDQWRILCIAGLLLLSGQVLRGTLAVYYVKYYLQQADLITAFMTLGMVGSILGCALSQFIANKVCKIKAYIWLQTIAACICILSYFVAAEQLILAFVLFFLWNFFLQMATPLLWAKMADTIDYGHWKTGIRITGMIYSAVVFFIKMGVAIGGALAGWLLAYYNYQADVVQTAATQHGILLSFTLYPAIGSLLVALTMRWYKLDNALINRIHTELNQPAK
ncbi:glycoside-pentoside-hexuronide (GPH):cation symporter [Thalassotalea sp. G2M2-11]|uniref:glycoside-pentoside-hexuronide (GPH):cation symporter n=1 Tax=Thalassotalea sp. G2M2-11 TaxID=2787627 RepID=UPI0019D2BEF3|nr:glycoside-pentoside-hexuronide (GPH):cation symporter [Thalassotalea sp. G2M2-11]